MASPEAVSQADTSSPSLERYFTPDQLKALQAVKAADVTPESENRGGDADSAAKAGEGDGNTASSADAAAKATDQPASNADEVVVDFSQGEGDETPDGADGATTGDEPEALSDEELAKLDEKTRKRVTEAHKEAAKVRKRAQAAEAEAKALKEKLAELEKQTVASGDALPQELTEHNSLAHVSDEALLARYDRDANNVLQLLRQLADAEKRGETMSAVYKSLVDGQEYDLSTDLSGYAAWAAGTVRDAIERRAQLGELKQAKTQAEKLEQKLKDTPGFTEALKGIQGQKLTTEWPKRRLQAAIGELVTSGQYRLIKISKGQAAGANSPATVAAPSPKKVANSTTTTPTREVRGTMPAPSRSGDGHVSTQTLSRLEAQAAKTGREEDIFQLMKAKKAIRDAQKRAA